MRSATAPRSARFRRALQLGDFARRRLPRGWAIRNLQAKAADPRSRILAVDYFGTVVTRTVPPWYVKLLAGRRLAGHLDIDLDPAVLYRKRLELEERLCRASLDRGADAQFRLDDLASELLDVVARSTEVGADLLPSAHDFIGLVLESEVQTEMLVQQVDRELVRVLKERSESAELVLVSDFYLPQRHFERFLDHHSLTDLFSQVFISCEEGRTKKSGRLFDVVADRLGASPADVLVVGDDPISDGRRARAAGMRSYVVPRKQWERRKHANLEDVTKDVERRLEHLLCPIDDRDLFPPMALTLYTFVHRLHDHLRSQRAGEAFFMAREGQLLARLFVAYEEELQMPSTRRIAARYLMTSRRSTYLPSLPPLHHPDLRSLLDQAPGLTTGQFLVRFGFDAATCQRLADDITGDATGATPLDPDAVLSHPGFEREYERRREEQRSALLAYVDEQMDLSAARTVHLVDVGWKGTTQDQLGRVVAEHHDFRLAGCYLGLLMAVPPEPPGSKTGILFQNQPRRSACLDVFTQFKAMFELLLSAEHGSVRGYSCSDEGARPVLDDSPAERAEYQRYLAALQVRFEQRFRQICRELSRCVIEGDDLLYLTARHHARMVFRPSKAEITFFENLPVYNAGGRLQRAAGNRREVERRRSLRAMTNLVRPHRLVGGGGWPPVRMRAAGVGWLRFPYGWYKLGVHRRRARRSRSRRGESMRR